MKNQILKMNIWLLTLLLLAACGGSGGKLSTNEYLGKWPSMEAQYHNEISAMKKELKECTDFKYIVTARYSSGSSLIGTGNLYIKLYTNDDKNTMTEKGTKIEVQGKCVGFRESTGSYFIDFLQE